MAITPTPVVASFESQLGEPLTVSFSEGAKGWTSFKSFIQDGGLSLNNDYYTFKSGVGAGLNLLLWKHHSNEIRNNFYDFNNFSHVDVLFNEESATVKSFASMKYEGSQAKITQNQSDEEYYNNIGKLGWYVELGETDLQQAGKMEFKDKEGKWFSYMKGVPVKTVDDLDSKEFSFQGIDILQSTTTIVDIFGCTDPTATNYNPLANIDDGSCVGGTFDCSSIIIEAYWSTNPATGVLEVIPAINSTDFPHTYTVTDANGVIYPNTSGPNPNPGGVYTNWVGLPSGQYTLEILSASGCQLSHSFNINLSAIDPCELVIASLSAIINTTPDTGTGNGGAQVVFDDPAGVLPYPNLAIYHWYTGTVANNVQDNTLVASSTGISTGGALNNPPSQDYINGLAAGNYHLSIDTGDGCYRWFDFVISGSAVYGCTDPTACNYNSQVTVSVPSSCEYCTCHTCSDPIAINYDPNETSTINNGSCCYDLTPTFNITGDDGGGGSVTNGTGMIEINIPTSFATNGIPQYDVNGYLYEVKYTITYHNTASGGGTPFWFSTQCGTNCVNGDLYYNTTTNTWTRGPNDPNQNLLPAQGYALMGGYNYGSVAVCNQTSTSGFGNTPPTTGNFVWQNGANYKITIKYRSANCSWHNSWCEKDFYIFMPCI